MVFDNRTNDEELESFGIWAADWITQRFSETQSNQIASVDNVRNQLALAGTGNTTNEKFARATGAEVVIQGNYYLLEDQIFVHSKIVDAITGQIIHALEPQSANRNKQDALLEQMTEKLLGFWMLNTRSKFNRRPPSYTAYQYYAKALSGRNDLQSIENLERAIKIDPGFYVAILKLGVAYSIHGLHVQRDSIVNLISQHETELTPWEKARYQSYAYHAEGDRVNLTKTYEEMIKIDPYDHISYGNAMTFNLVSLHRPEKALKIAYDYHDPFGFNSNRRKSLWSPALILQAHYALGEYGKVLSIVDSIGVEYLLYHYPLTHLRTLVRLGRKADIDYYLDYSRQQPLVGLQGKAVTLQTLLNRVCAEASIPGQKILIHEYANQLLEQGKIADDAYSMGKAYYYLGNYSAAIDQFQSVTLPRDKESFIEIEGNLEWLGCLYALTGNPDKALDCIDKIRESAPYRKAYDWNPYNIAKIYAHLGEKDKAVESLRDHLDNHTVPFLNLETYKYDPLLIPLFGYPDFEEFVKPKG